MRADNKKAAAAPSPVPVVTVCSVCGLDWASHGADPTTEDCIRLLKAELARRPVTVPIPMPTPYPVPWGERWPPWRRGGPIWVSPNHIDVVPLGTPRAIETQCKAVSA